MRERWDMFGQWGMPSWETAKARCGNTPGAAPDPRSASGIGWRARTEGGVLRLVNTHPSLRRAPELATKEV